MNQIQNPRYPVRPIQEFESPMEDSYEDAEDSEVYEEDDVYREEYENTPKPLPTMKARPMKPKPLAPVNEVKKVESLGRILLTVALCIAFLIAGIFIGATLW